LLTSHDHRSSEHFSDEEEAKSVRKLKRCYGNYKVKLPFKCFHCGKVGNFSSKCPFKESNTIEKGRKGKDKPREFDFFFKGTIFIQGRIKTTLQTPKKKNMR
jgi:hypothetical protein